MMSSEIKFALHAEESPESMLKNEGKALGAFKKIDERNSFFPQHLNKHHSDSKHLKFDSDCWRRTEIQKLFQLYDFYGPQWKVLAQNMPLRTANNLKNRFYTVLRNLVKLLFKKKGSSCPKLPGQIPSKDLSRLYDAREDYQQFGSLIKQILKDINYDLESPKIEKIVEEFSDEIIHIYKILYSDRLLPEKSEGHITEKTNADIIIPTTEPNEEKSSMTFLQSLEQIVALNLQAEKPSNFYYWLLFQHKDLFSS